MNIDELKSLIRPFPVETLIDLGLPEEDVLLFSKYKIIPIELLVPADWNYKVEDKEQDRKLSNNLKRNGQIENIHVRLLATGYYEVINGNHRLDEMLAIGKKFVIAFDHGPISLAEAQRITLETNELHYKADTLKLSKIIQDLSSQFDDLTDTLPYSDKEIEDFTSLNEFDWNFSPGVFEDTDDEQEIESYTLELVLTGNIYQVYMRIKEHLKKDDLFCFEAFLNSYLECNEVT